MLGHVAYDMYSYVRHMYSEALRVSARSCVKVEVSWTPVPNTPTVSVDVKQHFSETLLVSRFGLTVRR